MNQHAKHQELYDTIKLAQSSGLSVWPPRQDGSKRPLGDTWREKQVTPPTLGELRPVYSDKTVTGIGYITGAVSGNLECLDFDERGIYDDFKEAAISSGLQETITRLETGYKEHSPHGVHLLYRCDEIGANVKLASRPKRPEEINDKDDKTMTLIETRGEGGYIISAPSFGSVNTFGSYDMVSGSISTIPIITPVERLDLHTLARTFQVDLTDKASIESERVRKESTRQGGRPGDDYNDRCTWPDLLESHGWVHVFTDNNGVERWRRPGKTLGVSATVGHNGTNLFHCFTTSSEFAGSTSYTPFTAYTILNHHGDFASAAKDLALKGYGKTANRAESHTKESPTSTGAAISSFEQNIFCQKKFPVEVIPEPFDSLIETYATALQTSYEYVAMLMMTVISGAVGNTINISPKASWTVPPFFWFLYIDATGKSKSHPATAVMEPITELQCKAVTKYDKSQSTYLKELAAYKSDKIHNNRPEKPEPLRHYCTGNFTIEALTQMYRPIARGLITHVDEASAIIKGLNQYKKKGNDYENLIKLFDGGMIKSDRKGGLDFSTQSGTAFIGGIQRFVFDSLFGEMDYMSGLVYRFLPMLGNSPPSYFTLDDISNESSRQWSNIVDWMYKLPANIDPDSGRVIPTLLKFDDSALETWTEFQHRYTKCQPFCTPKFGGYIPKLITYSLKFVGILHVMECNQRDALTTIISNTTTKNAIALTEYFGGQTRQLTNGAINNHDPMRETIIQTLEQLHKENESTPLLDLVRRRLNDKLPESLQLDSASNKELATTLRDMGYMVKTGAGNKTHVSGIS